MTTWHLPRGQRTTSAGTSVRKVPALLQLVPWRRGERNIDIGSGRFPDGSRFLKRRGVRAFSYDPFNLDVATNRTAAKAVCCGKADTATIANVLNVIPERGQRRRVLQQAADATGAAGTTYIGVYEGDGSQRGGRTARGYQANRSLSSYLREVRAVFRDAQVEGSMIVARSPRRVTCACPIKPGLRGPW
jgi:hypothetical protein